MSLPTRARGWERCTPLSSGTGQERRGAKRWGERIGLEGLGGREEAVRGGEEAAREERHPNLVMSYRGMRCGSSSGCGRGRSWRGLPSSGRSARRTSWRVSASAEPLAIGGCGRSSTTALLSRARLVYGQPALYVPTREGLAWAGIPHVEPARVGVATTRHWATCGRLAERLEREHGGVEVWGEPRLRAAELEAERPVASAQHGVRADGRPRLRRPDLVLFPPDTAPVAVEVELSGQGRAAGGDLSRVGAMPDRQ